MKLLHDAKKVLFLAIVASVQELAEKVRGQTPKWSHVVFDTVWIKGMCKKHLIDGLDRSTLSKSTTELHRALFHANDLHGKFGLGPATMDSQYEACELAKCVFEEAKQTITVVAHVHVLQVLKANEQLVEAVKLDQKDSKVPQTLKAAIQVLALKGASLLPNLKAEPASKRVKTK